MLIFRINVLEALNLFVYVCYSIFETMCRPSVHCIYQLFLMKYIVSALASLPLLISQLFYEYVAGHYILYTTGSLKSASISNTEGGVTAKPSWKSATLKERTTPSLLSTSSDGIDEIAAVKAKSKTLEITSRKQNRMTVSYWRCAKFLLGVSMEWDH